MHTKKILSSVALLFACLAQMGCALEAGSEGKVGSDDDALDTADQNAPPKESNASGLTGTWIVVGGESCGDVCGTTSCGCLPGCPGKPRAGDPCTPSPRSCYSYGRGEGAATELFCRSN